MSAAPASSTARTSPASSAGSDPGPQRQVDVGQAGGLGRSGVGHDDRPAPGPQAAQRHEGVGAGHRMAVGHHRVLAHHEEEPGGVPVGDGEAGTARR